ncbi:MAG: hypothetical protein IJX80_04915 [Clostridia bacterium]|nr:hypothetical protein [Clostridia bacterium]
MFNRETLPSITTLENICKAFNISMSEFFEDESNEALASPQKKEFVRLYETLSPSAREAVFNLMKSLSDIKK